MNRFQMTAWLAKYGLGYTKGTLMSVSEWAANRSNGQEYCDYGHDGEVRIKTCNEELPQIWQPLDNMSDAWLLVEAMTEHGDAPKLIFDDNLVEEMGAWCLTCDGCNGIPNPSEEDVPELAFTGFCEYWYVTPELAICAAIAHRQEKILVQEKEDQFELYDLPSVKISPELELFTKSTTPRLKT